MAGELFRTIFWRFFVRRIVWLPGRIHVYPAGKYECSHWPGDELRKEKAQRTDGECQGTLYIFQFCRAEIRHAGNLQGCSGRRI